MFHDNALIYFKCFIIVKYSCRGHGKKRTKKEKKPIHSSNIEKKMGKHDFVTFDLDCSHVLFTNFKGLRCTKQC